MWTIDGEIIRAKQLGLFWKLFNVGAMVRWGTIYYTEPFSDSTKRHELVHREQQRKQHKWIVIGYQIFLFKYIGWWVRLLFTKGKQAYRDNPFEVEARAKYLPKEWEKVTKNSYKEYVY